MELKLCRRCKSLFQYTGGKPICTACKKEEEQQFMEIRDYLRDNPKATFVSCSDATGVPVKLIEDFIKEGRLVLSPSSPMAPQCETCGKDITTGRLCQQCLDQLGQEVKGNFQKQQQAKGMRSTRR
ncbi:MAG: hypothetical protein ATN36_00915 [Epulopiscium sp. Nele67-Bin005]|nr:MAG: hypothetical protein ATN36_00915 [Epulopiscium sp. Nele67-Bin005]